VSRVGGTPAAAPVLMRSFVLTTSILGGALASAPVVAQPHRVDDVTARGLTAEQVQRYAAVYYPAIRACYLELGERSPGATGELAINQDRHRPRGPRP
jgi:hypothetical protein